MSEYEIPFNRACLTGDELRYVTEAIENGHISSNGSFTRRCSALLEDILGVQSVSLTTSCTHALEASALLLDLGPGDEVIVPSFAFVTTAAAFALRSAKIVFADVRPDTLNLDERLVGELVTTRTKAIVALHYAGVGCEMEALTGIAGESGIKLIEDNAHGLFGSYRGQPLGSLGTLATLSFHETKNVSCGEGGALVVNDPALRARAEVILDKGTNRADFVRGIVNRYTWVDHGSSYMPSDLLAAFLLAQLESRHGLQAQRERAWRRYRGVLTTWAETNGVALPHIPAHCRTSYHIFHMIMPSSEGRARFIEHLRRRGILAIFHYPPLHLSEMGRRYGGRLGDCPITEDLSERLVRLPLHGGLSVEHQERVIAAVTAFE